MGLLDEGAKVSAPEVSPIEKDAMTLMQGRVYMQHAQSKTRESLDAAKQRSGYGGSSDAPVAPGDASSGTQHCSAKQRSGYDGTSDFPVAPGGASSGSPPCSAGQV